MSDSDSDPGFDSIPRGLFANSDIDVEPIPGNPGVYRVTNVPSELMERLQEAQATTVQATTDQAGVPLTGVVRPQAPEVPEFGDWALLWVGRNAPEVAAKAREYGSNSLMEMGRLFRRAQGNDSISDAEAIEVGAFLYAYGKMQRVADAMLRGEVPKIDQWHDTAIYSLMAMYTREKGSWP